MKIAKECDEDDLDEEEGEEVEMLSDENKNINRSHLTRQMDLILYACWLIIRRKSEVLSVWIIIHRDPEMRKQPKWQSDLNRRLFAIR